MCGAGTTGAGLHFLALTDEKGRLIWIFGGASRGTEGEGGSGDKATTASVVITFDEQDSLGRL